MIYFDRIEVVNMLVPSAGTKVDIIQHSKRIFILLPLGTF